MISNLEIYILLVAILSAMLVCGLASVYRLVSLSDLAAIGLALVCVLALYTIKKKIVRIPSVPDGIKP